MLLALCQAYLARIAYDNAIKVHRDAFIDAESSGHVGNVKLV